MATVCFIIHGIGNQGADFSTAFQRAVEKQLEAIASKPSIEGEQPNLKAIRSSLDFVPIYWAEISVQEQENLYRKICPAVSGNRWLPKHIAAAIQEPTMTRELSLTLIGDIFAYLGRFEEPIKKKVFEKVASALAPKLQSNEPLSIILVGHSLGTVILHDLLSTLARLEVPIFKQLAARTSVITMGSPIPLFSFVAQNAPLGQYKRWINVRHGWDAIAFPLAPLFPEVIDERVTCWWPPSLWSGLLNPHSVYWRHPKVHKLVAAEIVDHYTSGAPTALRGVPLSFPPLEVFLSGNRGASDAGLIGYEPDYRNFVFDSLVKQAAEIDICIIYGGTWARSNAGAIRLALQNPKTRIRVCLVSPKSPALDGLCFQFGNKTREELQNRIRAGGDEFVGALNAARASSNTVGTLQIYYSMNPPCHGFYRFDQQVYVTPRSMCGDRLAAEPLPIAIYRKTQNNRGMFEWIMRDFELLLSTPSDSSLVFDSTTRLDTR